MSIAVTVSLLKEYTDSDAASIGHMMPALSINFTDNPTPRALLEEIILSPYHEQLVARDDKGYIVGTATLSIILGAGMRKRAWLEDFVTDPDVRGKGVSQAMWDEVIRWCKDRQLDLHFTSKPTREAAHHFYLKNGAEIRNTSVFKRKV